VPNSDNHYLLEKSFSPDEWEYLQQNPAFKELLSSQNETLDDYESLVDAGILLLRRRAESKGPDPIDPSSTR
jgi:hypothetical protein